jgi:peptidoglycan/LPS O-acetylase OafA/YrhL
MSKPRWVTALFRALSRETSSGRFIPEIDGLRFVAIAGVLMFHLVGYIGLRVTERTGSLFELSGPIDHALYAVGEVGNFGVQLFFGISGFILALPFATADLNRQPRPSLRRYFLRRLTRLEPPYIINMLAWYAAQVIEKGGSVAALFPHFLASIFYVHNIVYGKPSVINQIAWTLEIEVQFYIAAPLLSLAFRIRRAAVRRAIIVVVMALMPVLQFAVFPSDSEYVSRSLLGQLQYFLVGFLLADFYLTDWNQTSTTNGLWDLLGIAAWLGLLAVLITTPPVVQAAVGPLLIFIAYVTVFRGSRSRAIFRWRPIVIIGGMCYTIYLFHWMAYYALGKLTMRLYNADAPFWWNVLIQTIILVPLAIAACAVLFLLFEKPFMKPHWVDDVIRWFGGRRNPSAAGVSDNRAACPGAAP